MGYPQILARYLDERVDERDNRFNGEFSCRLVSASDETRVLLIRPIDVSRRGLGFLAREPVQTGACFWLIVGQARFRVEIAYCCSHLGIEDLFRCGLFLREADGDLAESCRRAGILSKT